MSPRRDAERDAQVAAVEAEGKYVSVLPTSPADIFICRQCGAVVYYRDVHDQWHQDYGPARTAE